LEVQREIKQYEEKLNAQDYQAQAADDAWERNK
jgi:hypothetical protein